MSRSSSTDRSIGLHLPHGLVPTEPEVIGLLALIRLHRARAAARLDQHGNLVLLRDQNRTLWDHEAIAAASQLLSRAARFRRPGPCQLQAAIVACHAEASTWADTDWPQILVLYGMLLAHAPSPVTRADARTADRRALELTANPAEQALLEQRILET